MKNHSWQHCNLCDHEVVICGKCGNNTCNGGYGEIDGKDCDKCPEAYQLYKNGNHVDKQHISEIRRVMPTIIAYDIVGVSPFKGPTEEAIEKMRIYKEVVTLPPERRAELSAIFDKFIVVEDSSNE